ncbi:MAG: hypothetical protein AAF899_16435 [Pseudomonadota bacterium]
MLGLIDRLTAVIGPTAAVSLFLAAALATALYPFWTWRKRGAWPVVKARVINIASRRTLASNTWAIGVELPAEADAEPVNAVVQVNLVRQPLSIGDTLEVLRHPRWPGRVALTRWQGAGTPLMLAPLIALGALAVIRDG